MGPQKLVELHKAGQLSFEHVVTVNMDEYVGLLPTHEQSYHAFMWTNLFEHIDIRPENVHILDGMAEDLQAECDKVSCPQESAESCSSQSPQPTHQQRATCRHRNPHPYALAALPSVRGDD